MKKIAFTIITSSYLWAARVLIREFRKHSDSSDLYVIVTDMKSSSIENEKIEGAKFLPGSTVFTEKKFDDLAFVYNAFELCCVLRPFAHEYFFREKHADRVLFLDSDIFLLSDPWYPFENCKYNSIVLSPHIMKHTNIELVDKIDLNLLRTGIFNGGVLQLNRCNETMRFLDWFKERQLRFGFYAMKNSSDQIWLNLIPALFKEYKILANIGVNVGWWNIHERPILKSADGKWKIGNIDLHSVHFSHWSPIYPDVLSSILPKLKAPKEWKELSKLYSRLCLNAGYESCKKIKYKYGYFESGLPIEPWMRLAYSEIIASGKNLPESPFKSSKYFLKLSRKRQSNECLNLIRECIRSIRRCIIGYIQKDKMS